MTAVNRVAGTQIPAGAGIPVVNPDGTNISGGGGGAGDASAANQDEQTALLTTIDADTSNLSVVGGGTEAAAIRVTIANNSTGVLSVDDNGGVLTVDGTVTANLGATDSGALAAIQTAVEGTLDVGIGGVIDVAPQVDGADVASGNPMWVRQVALSSVDLPLVAGTVAHDSADSGNPVKIGGKAVSTAPTAVTANDRVDAQFTLTGKQVIQPYALPSSHVSGLTGAITDTTTTQVIAAPGAGLKLYITHIIVQNSDATVGTWVILEEETSGTNLYQVYAGPLGGGASITLPTPLVVPTAAKGLFALCETTSAEVRVSASGYTAP